MKLVSLLIFSALILVLGLGVAVIGAEQNLKERYLSGVDHFKQSTIKISGGKTIYFDPFRVDGEAHDADLVLISHPHGDHLSIPDLKKIAKATTTFAVPDDAAEKMRAEGFSKLVLVTPNQSYQAEGISFKTVPAYNINKEYHPKEKNWVGYIIDFNKIKYYFAGDTDLIPEMKGFKTDVAFLPVGGKYTMTAEEATQAANLIKPKVAVPIHFLDVVGTLEDAQKFVTGLKTSVSGVILKKL